MGGKEHPDLFVQIQGDNYIHEKLERTCQGWRGMRRDWKWEQEWELERERRDKNKMEILEYSDSWSHKKGEREREKAKARRLLYLSK